MQLAKRVWDFSTSQGLLQDGDLVVVGVSGGPDSLCLLDVLDRLAPRHGLTLVVAHLNHGLRPEAADEAAFVQAQAERRGLGFFSAVADVAAAARESKQSIESAARRARYDFFSRVARDTGARRVAVAHTADDQAETVLMHLLRGMGLRGLRGMLPKRVVSELVIGNWVTGEDDPLPINNYQLPLLLIRPLLSINRAEIMAYCAEAGLSPRLDASNEDPRYFRNRLRHALLPMLETYNPNVRAVLARTAAVAAGDYEIWLGAVERLWTETVEAAPAEPGRKVFDRGRWLALSPAQQRALLRMAVEQLVTGPDEIDFAPLEAAAQFSRGAEPGRSCELAAGVVMQVTAESIVVLGQRSNSDVMAEPRWMAGPRVVAGALVSGWRLLIEPLGTADWGRDQIAMAPRWTAYVDADRLVRAVEVRARRPGDRFQPIGLDGHSVSLAEFMANEKVPAEQRDEWPLLVCGDEIVWVAGLRLDERYKVREDTRRVSRVSLIAEADE